MTPINRSFFAEVKSFASSNKALCILTLGIAIVGFSTIKLFGRFVSWIKEESGVAKKTTSISTPILQTTLKPGEPLTPQAVIGAETPPIITPTPQATIKTNTTASEILPSKAVIKNPPIQTISGTETPQVTRGAETPPIVTPAPPVIGKPPIQTISEKKTPQAILGANTAPIVTPPPQAVIEKPPIHTRLDEKIPQAKLFAKQYREYMKERKIGGEWIQIGEKCYAVWRDDKIGLLGIQNKEDYDNKSTANKITISDTEVRVGNDPTTNIPPQYDPVFNYLHISLAKVLAKQYFEYMKEQNNGAEDILVDNVMYTIWADPRGFLGIQDKKSYDKGLKTNIITISDIGVWENGISTPTIPSQYDPVLNCLHTTLEWEALLRDFEDFAPTDVNQQSLSDLVKLIRNIGRRRPEEWIKEDYTLKRFPVKGHSDLDIIRREAKFLGITEVEYKQYLCSKNPSRMAIIDPNETNTWQAQIANEQEIKSYLQKYCSRNPLSQPEWEDLIKKLVIHPPLSKPIYFAQLYFLFKAIENQNHSAENIVKEALKKTIAGVNSRRIQRFCNQALAEIKKSYPTTSNADIQNILSQTIVPPTIPQSTPENERAWILQQIDFDIQQLQFLHREPHTRSTLLTELKKRNLPLYIQEQGAQEVTDTTIHLFLTTWEVNLKKFQDILRDWKGPNPKYYHASSHWKDSSADSVLVSGGKTNEKWSRQIYAGAFVSKEGPILTYGEVCFAFSDNIEKTGHTVETSSVNNEYWYGFNRSIPVNPQAQLFKKECREKVYNSISVPSNLSPIEQRAFKMGVMLWLENWTTLKYDETLGWQFAMVQEVAPGPGKKVDTRIIPPNPPAARHLETNQEIIASKLREVLIKAFPQCRAEISPLKFPHMEAKKPDLSLTPQPDTGLLAVFVHEKSINQEEVQQQLRQRGIPEKVQVLPWEMGHLWANYMIQARGVTHPFVKGSKDSDKKEKAHNPNVDFF